MRQGEGSKAGPAHAARISKWRPPLWMVVGTTLAVVLSLPIIGIFFVRYMWPVVGYREAVWIAGFGALFATFGFGWMLWRILLRPMTELKSRAEALKMGREEGLAPLDHYGTSDMRLLGQAIADMGGTLHSREAVLRGYADHVTHELKSPLTVVRGAAELLGMDGLPQAERDRLIARIGAAADRMTQLLDAQRALAQAQEPAASGQARLSDVVAHIRDDQGQKTSAAGGDVQEAVARIEVAQDGVVPLPQDTLQLVLEHLIGNAAAHGAHSVTLSFDGILSVQDDGPGISEGNRGRIFEPFFTTRRDTGGTGMGLSIVRRVLQAHGAQISLVAADGAQAGARFEIVF